MPYIGYEPAKKPLTSADITDGIITSASISDGTIVNADINASAGLALSKLSTTGTASSSNYLRGDGAWTAISSDYVLLATTTVSSAVASVTLDNYFTSTYTTYKILITNCMAATNNRTIYMQFRRSGADVTSGYFTVSTASQMDATGGGNVYSDSDVNLSYIPIIPSVQASRGSFTLSSEITLWNPLETSKYQTASVVANGTYDGGATYPYFYTYNRQCYVNSTGALSGIKFYVSGSATNITSGTFKLYGLK
jgi:hypothetical protein